MNASPLAVALLALGLALTLAPLAGVDAVGSGSAMVAPRPDVEGGCWVTLDMPPSSAGCKLEIEAA